MGISGLKGLILTTLINAIIIINNYEKLFHISAKTGVLLKSDITILDLLNLK